MVGAPKYSVAEKDNWLWIAVAGAIAAILGFFAMGKTVNVQAGQAKSPGCSCGR